MLLPTSVVVDLTDPFRRNPIPVTLPLFLVGFTSLLTPRSRFRDSLLGTSSGYLDLVSPTPLVPILPSSLPSVLGPVRPRTLGTIHRT